MDDKKQFKKPELIIITFADEDIMSGPSSVISEPWEESDVP